MKLMMTKNEIRAMLRRELQEYMTKIGPLTLAERKELREWVASGHSVYDNPYTLYDESGFLMDFIQGLRIGNDMRDNPSVYSWEDSSVSIADADGIPF